MNAYYRTVTEAEQGILASLIANKPENLSWRLALKPDYFSDKRHRIIFSAIAQLDRSGFSIDKILLKDFLIRSNELDAAGGEEYLNSFQIVLQNQNHFADYAEVIKTAAMKRRLVSVGEKLKSAGENERSDVQEDWQNAVRDLNNAEENFFDCDIHSASSLATNLIYDLDIKMNRENSITGLATGFDDLDRICGGLQPGELIILAARPAMGKTALLLSLIENISASQNIPVLFFSLEMSGEQLMNRLVGIHSSVPADKIRSGSLEEHEYRHVFAKTEEVKAAPFFIVDTNNSTYEKLRMIALNLKNSSNIKLLVIDYLQLMQGTKRKYSYSREQEISEISKNLKRLARELQIPVLVTSQLSRAPETRGGDKKPILSDLRESGAIEQDADKVLFLYRAEYYGFDCDSDGSNTKDVAEIIIAKNRSGPVGTVRLKFLSRYARFENLDALSGDKGQSVFDIEQNIKNKFEIFGGRREDNPPPPF